MKLKITRYDNGEVKTIGLIVSIVNRYGGLDDEFAPPVEHPIGPFFRFDEKGHVIELAEYENPKIDPKYFPAEVYRDDLRWSKTCNAQGQLDKVIGKPKEETTIGWFTLTREGAYLFKTLKSENLIPAVEKVLPLVKKLYAPQKVVVHKRKATPKNLARVKE